MPPSTAARDVTPGDREYPARIAALDAPPARLSIAGAPLDANRVHVAIVGTRGPSASAEAFAAELAASCVAAGAVVVSGGATGIDAAAHTGALDACGPTVSVLGTGRHHVYPVEHRGLYDRIAESGGTLVWPFAPRARALPANFTRRNRILVALADVVVVVQAPARSGALNAARHARLLGRPVWAVLAAPWETSFAGSARLIEHGATPLTTVAHFLRSVGLTRDTILPLSAPKRSRPPPAKLARNAGNGGASEYFRERTPDEERIVEAIGERTLHVDEVIRITGRSSGWVLSALLTLALAGVLVEGPEGFYRRLTDL